MMRRLPQRKMVDAPPPAITVDLPPPTAEVASAPAVDWPYYEIFPGITPRARLGDKDWWVKTDDAVIQASRFAITGAVGTAPINDVPAASEAIAALITIVAAKAEEIFAGANVCVSASDDIDNDTGASLTRVDVDVRGMSREEFRPKSRLFDAFIAATPDAALGVCDVAS
jgi:hypothetical protein